MTKIDIFSGFLGAGKTTLIKKLLESDAPMEQFDRLGLDKDCIYTTNSIKNDYSPLFISTDDIVSVLAELLDNEDNFIMREACHRIAWKLHIVDDLEKKINER